MTGAVLLTLLLALAAAWLAWVHHQLTADRRPSRRPLDHDLHLWEDELR